MRTLTVTENITEYLRCNIIANRFTPGQKLNEITLTSELDVSSAPLREAFRILQNEHLIISLPRKGTYVTELSFEDLQGVSQARRIIECNAIDFLKAKNIKDLPRVASSLERASGLPLPTYDDQSAMVQYLRAFVDYHIKLVESSGNDWLVRFYKSLSSTLIRYQFICLYVPGQLIKSKEQHEEILNLIKKGRYEQAKQHLISHINSLVTILESKMEKSSIGKSSVGVGMTRDVISY